MNPSATDWINKFIHHFEEQQLIDGFTDEIHFYNSLKTSGFLYGLSVQSVLNEKISTLLLTREEYTKVNLFHTLVHTYYTYASSPSFEDTIENSIQFYKELDKGKTGFLKKLSFSQKPAQILEQILSARLQETNNLLKKNATSIFTYALLYVDVLAFRQWLEHPKDVKLYASEIESIVITCCFLALKSKEQKNKYDFLLIDLFESSSEYLVDTTLDSSALTLEGLPYLTHRTYLEKRFLLDLCCIAVWDDHEMDASELDFLKRLSAILSLPDAYLDLCIKQLVVFSETHAKKISLFEYSNPVQHFYKQSTATVKLLILRNKNRLLKELDESGELVLLLGQSALRDLSAEEKTKVKRQLLDVCKTIPSLTIFLLPGGTILLPLLVKFIPKLLPSAFNENRVDRKK